MNLLGVVGGTGMDTLPDFSGSEQAPIETPYGAPTQAPVVGQIAGQQLVFLHRHGQVNPTPPHLVNYRANVHALAQVGVTHLIGVNAVGGIGLPMHPGALVIPDQIIDYTWGREHTFEAGNSGQIQYIDFAHPYDQGLRQQLIETARELALEHVDHGTYGATQGPRLETAAEIRRMQRDGCNLVGMTGMPEAALAMEAGIAYASVCMVVNAASGMDDRPLSLDTIVEILQRESGVVGTLIAALAHRFYGN